MEYLDGGELEYMDKLGSLLEAEIPHLRRYARALLKNAEEADDLVQACLEKALEKSDQWNPSRGLRPWLFRIQHNIFVSWLRRRDRERNLDGVSPERQAVDGAHEARVEIKAIEHALDTLPTEQRTVVLLVALEGMSYQEVAQVMSIPVGTVRSRLSRGRETLRSAVDGVEANPAVQGGRA